LADVWRYTAAIWGIEHADAYERAIRDALELLLEHPGIGSVTRYRGLVYRRWRVGEHHLIFRQTSGAMILSRVLHVRHDR